MLAFPVDILLHHVLGNKVLRHLVLQQQIYGLVTSDADRGPVGSPGTSVLVDYWEAIHIEKQEWTYVNTFKYGIITKQLLYKSVGFGVGAPKSAMRTVRRLSGTRLRNDWKST